ncbi:efflux RND transporter periplasmic adaptor subunit [Pseudomonas sp. BCA14]|uniref:efflux RND transporter periplasmic adaptor subunit n=1 Tax=unclassified Pseudomonas TaxID=196821 RepID=UPI00106EF276|nr:MULTISPECIES: efflux RND transporter periplasmic adaptor subunit [unclassified Pseudomonas]TFF07167.1 efflux RND transporter periplasmic adaptor subunit [Pseudomonas sp. JMN1]TFF10728.1 efflux RND transporter periplasmic adaptor subunit [Pseudomonas sp. BCA17]TFF18555.1 efflux RND transporter periplasmic adaptor subunit [Pseudomonas sp. BCA14]TFF23544.1 efflux RND transporter periplasmic adaptor subunit [Pseudomonas sp. BCA13]
MLRLRPVTLAACLLPLVLTACGDSSTAVDPRTLAPLVRVAQVQDSSTAGRSFTGVVAARVQSDLGFRVSGKVLERLVDAGQTVKKGQPLMRLDPIDLGLQARAQQEAVTAAHARAKQTADDEARYRELVAAGAISASGYDQIKAAADTAKAQLSAAEAQADVARNASGYAVLLADADGVVMETLAEPGQVVSPGQPVVRLARAGQREAVVQLPETLRPAAGSSAQATLYGNAAGAVNARLRLLSDSADRVTRTFEARYVLEGAMANAPLGSTVTLRIVEGAVQEQVMQVPIAALYDPGNGPGVWVIDGEPAKVSWRPVHVLGLSDDTARVAGQLNVGERIVGLGAHLLREGEPVRLLEQGDVKVAGSRQ